ncbi:FliM/FliN family flagellar motor switch protein [Vibrio cincinnatiensis]|uniref:FliM/FliN family flagellar motor switch protein n=1 Tax=Vibrio cincinnatiensis TaxID=675 RepID=UPI001EDFB185|nr:FliM/FliN family flagellar motor switch protein [Vibrio cincinnatiensis]MCG3723705.1 flagellar motor switch protein [Vibrio cincinnatiensis]
MSDLLIEELSLDEFKPLNEPKNPIWKKDIIKDVEVSIEVRLGSATITVNELFSWKKGSLLTLDNRINAPIDILLNKKVVGKGLLVACGEHYGIEITDVIE